MHVGPDHVVLRGLEDLEIDGQLRYFALSWSRKAAGTLSSSPTATLTNALARPSIRTQALAETQAFWRDWIGASTARPPTPRPCDARCLTLKALIHRPTGGLVAAPTTSLPEQPGGPMNWDYRYCWLRDATFTLTALVDCGFLEEATAWRDWMLRAVAGEPDKMQIMYRVDGSRRLDEAELPWLPGYRFARPVRIGNAAAGSSSSTSMAN